jgi:hypothetical protein
MADLRLSDLYMAVRAFEAGIIANKKELDAMLDELRDDMGLVAPNFRTRYGLLVGKLSKEAITFEDAGLLAWARKNAAWEVVEAYDEEVTTTVTHPATTHASLRNWLTDRCEVIDGQVIDKETGEALAFAHYKPEEQTWAANLTKQAKAEAAAAIRDRLPQLVELMSAPAPKEVEQ